MPLKRSKRRRHLVASAIYHLILAATLAFRAAPVHATDRAVYALRADENGQGIVRYDPLTRSRSAFARFIYVTTAAYEGRLHLTALSDRLVAQGSAFHEFDLGSAQLLRRYSALSPAYNTWAFQGVAVDDVTAARVGLQPGFYGFPVCPVAGDVTGLGCHGPVMFPGYLEPVLTVPSPQVFLRRGLAPGDTALTVAKVFPADESVDGRFAALDVGRRQFWFWINSSQNQSDLSYTPRLTAAPIINGTIGEETTAREFKVFIDGPPETQRVATSFAYNPYSDAFLQSFLYYRLRLERRLIQTPVTGGQEVELDRSMVHLHSPTTIPDALPQTYVQVLPAIGDTPGANGTYWRSDAWLFNPSDSATAVTMTRVSRPLHKHTVTLAPRASTKLTNVLAQFGGGATRDGIGVDALVIESPYRSGAQVSVYSRTYTDAPSGGTYGQAIPAVPSRVGYSNHLRDFGVRGDLIAESDSLLVLDKRDPTRFRHNLGIVNHYDEALTVRLRYATVSSHTPPDSARDVELSVAPHSVHVATIEHLFPARITDVMPPRVWVSADRPAPLWLSMVDNRTGDAAFIPFTVYGVEADAQARLAFPAVAHAPGANGTFWTTDVHGVFPAYATGDGEPQRPDANFYAGDTGCANASLRLRSSPGAPLSNAFPWSPFWYTTFADVGRQVCDGGSVLGALDVRTGSWMAAFARTYTTTADGGTYGEILPLYPPRGWRLRHFAGIEVSDSARVNVGLYNGSDAITRTLLQAYRSDGSLAAERIIELSARGFIQQPLRELLNAELPNALYALSLTTLEGVGSWPYVSTVDNVTGDPTIWW